MGGSVKSGLSGGGAGAPWWCTWPPHGTPPSATRGAGDANARGSNSVIETSKQLTSKHNEENTFEKFGCDNHRFKKKHQRGIVTFLFREHSFVCLFARGIHLPSRR